MLGTGSSRAIGFFAGRRSARFLSYASILTIVALASGAARAQQGPFVYVPNGGSNDVSVIDAPTNAVVPGTIVVGTNPQGAAVRGDES